MQQGPSKAFQPASGASSTAAAEKAALKEQKRKERSLAPEPPTPKHAATTSLQPSPPAQSGSEDEDEEDEEEGVANDEDLSSLDSNESLGLSDDEDEGIEEAYAAKKVAERLKALAAGGKADKGKKRKAEEDVDEEDDDEEASESEAESGADSEDDEADEEEELDIDNLQHESVHLPKAIYKEVKATPAEVKKMQKKAKAINDDDETPEQRDARTVFIGNVPVECSTSRVRL